MARPITWQDVSAPRGSAVAIEALLRSGRQAGEGFEQIGQTFMDANVAQKAAATGAAVAAIANSDDPTAQAAATQNGWQFDPLAIATAANARGEQIQESRAREQTISSARAVEDKSRAELQDLEDERDSEAIIQRNIEASLKAGRVVLSEEDSNRGQASVKAGKELEARLRAQKDDQRADRAEDRANREFGLRAREAKLREDELKRTQALRAARAELVLMGASEAGANEEPKNIPRVALEVFAKHGADPSDVNQGVESFGLGLSGNKPLDSEQEQLVQGGRGETFKTYHTALATEAQALEKNHAVQMSRFEQYNNTAANLAKSEFANMTEEAAAFALAKKYDWDPDEARDRMKEAADSAPEGVTLTPEMKAEVAAATSGSFRGWFKDSWANSPAAQARLDEYIAFQQAGGEKGLTTEMAQLSQRFEVDKAALEKQARRLDYATRSGNADAIPTELRRSYLTQQQVERDALEEQLRERTKLANAANRELKRQEKLEADRAKRAGPDDWRTWRR